MFKQQLCPKAILVVLTLGVCASTVCAQVQPDPRAASRAQFKTIYSRLDIGGDLLVVANMEGMIEESIGKLIDGIALVVPTADPKTRTGIEMLEKLPAFLKKNGLYAVNGFGMSSVPRADGLNNVKVFIGRDVSAIGTPFWRGLVGYGQRRLKSLDYLPAETVAVRASNADVGEIWKLVRAVVSELAPPEAAAAFEKSLGGLTPVLGVELETLIESLGDESLVSIQLSPDTQVAIPVPAGPRGAAAAPPVIMIPEPSFLIAITIKNNAIPQLIDQRIAAMSQPGQPAPVTKVQFGGATIQAMTFAIPQSPIPLQPAFTVHGGFFILGSTPAVVKKALTVATNKRGLLSVPKFKKAFEGLPMTNNGLFYVDPLFSRTVQEVQLQMMGSIPSQAGGEGAAAAKALQQLFMKDKPYSCAMVVLNWKSGVLIQGVTTSGAKEVVAGSTIAPIGLLAAIAIPSFVKARTQAQRNACINNLRMLDSAKEQWALASMKRDGDLPVAADVTPYIRGDAMPVCPKGGVYAINPLGIDPACSRDGALGQALGRR